MFGMFEKWRQEMRQLSIPVWTLIALFAIASWIDINGIFSELPLMVNVLPEGWDLPSYIVIIIQAANTGPLIYTILKKLFPNKVKEWYTIIIIISIGVIACIFLGFFWDYTTGTEADGSGGHSTALFTLATFLALVDCTSSVVFLPYMATFREQYLNGLYFGEGLSGLIPAILGLIQGIGGDPQCVNQTTIVNGTEEYQIVAKYEEPRFGVGTFYFILSGVLAVSLISFVIVHFHSAGRRERQFRSWNKSSKGTGNKIGSTNFKDEDTFDESSINGVDNLGNSVSVVDITKCDSKRGSDVENGVFFITNSNNSSDSAVQLQSFNRLDENGEKHKDCKNTDSDTALSINIKEPESLLTIGSITTLLIVAWINALSNGVLPSIQTYSCLPYGNRVYNLSVRLSVAANPIACFFGIFVTAKSLWVFLVLTFLATVCSAYQLALASLSPTPPLYDHESGGPIAIATFVILTALFSYTKMCCAARLGERSGGEGLLWCGVVTQIGSCIGAIIIFILVNNVKVFKSKYVCT